MRLPTFSVPLLMLVTLSSMLSSGSIRPGKLPPESLSRLWIEYSTHAPTVTVSEAGSPVGTPLTVACAVKSNRPSALAVTVNVLVIVWFGPTVTIGSEDTMVKSPGFPLCVNAQTSPLAGLIALLITTVTVLTCPFSIVPPSWSVMLTSETCGG